jgi:hypothetical protein
VNKRATITAMPSSVRELFSANGLKHAGSVRWGHRLRETQTGVYVIALTGDPDELTAPVPQCPLNPSALEELVRVCPRLSLDGAPTTAAAIGVRIASFWIADEVAVYIGRAGQPIAERVSQYYRTPIGAPRPHKGGWWIKTLSVLPQLWVHWARTLSDVKAEGAMLHHFAYHLSPSARSALPAGPVMPFANLMDGAHRRKVHGIANATTADTARTSELRPRSTPVAKRTVPTMAKLTTRKRPSPRRLSSPPLDALTTQRVTAADRAGGRIRFPRASKRLLPDYRSDISVRVHGHELVCRWDPRYGPPERSGVLMVGRAFAAEHLAENEVLAVAVDANVVVLSRLDG